MKSNIDTQLRFKSESFIDVSPLTKIIIFVILSVLMLQNRSLCSEIIVGVVTTLILINSKAQKRALLFTSVYFGTILFELVIKSLPISNLVGFVFGLLKIIRLFLPTLSLYYVLSERTSASEYLSMFKRFHIPDSFAVSFVVMLRLIPTLKEHIVNIQKALRFRNLKIGPILFLTQPAMAIERIVVPLLISSGKVIEELSAAALTRGLDVGRKRNPVLNFKLTFVDFLVSGMMITIFIFFGRFS
ncbi:energy-coupling factor transporter transmembrane component T [Bavariicoccus seileri]|uniref:energy-coupling factor transporter transmembrane component T n=1 Tax=Bavariicoccus seileri TaxID=549685 RepID=UPI0003B45A54|nr:energy-coupling factor transporter transmembrane component T [Bavariicoccus seileri]